MTEYGDGPDPNDVRRHAKRMYTEFQYRQKYRRIDFYKPNNKQRLFHNTIARERMLRAGNQQGKTHSVGAEMVFHALALYPEWPDSAFTGRKFLTPPKIERPYDFIGWAGCTTSSTTRNGIQAKLLGDFKSQGGLGTGLIPLDNITRVGMARGIDVFVDTINLTREGGGPAIIRQKTYEMGREGWQGEPVDVIWLDEDLGTDAGKQDIYGECLARLTTTDGIIMISMTPVPGATEMRKRFKAKTSGTAEINMNVNDTLVSNGGHIPDERLPELLSQYKESERATRLYGADMQGEGSVFDFPVDGIKHRLDPADVPLHWPWLWGMDFRHSGSISTGHPFAAVLACWDRDSDTIYVMHVERMLGLASSHVVAMKAYPRWEAPVAWPHDGGRGGSVVSGDTLAQTYKKLGLNMRPTHATLPEGGFDFEGGLRIMENRFGAGKLKIAAHLHAWFDEYAGYHRKNGLVVKVDDDLLSATRVLCMDIRFARTVEQFTAYRRSRQRGQRPPGTDFDLHTGL